MKLVQTFFIIFTIGLFASCSSDEELKYETITEDLFLKESNELGIKNFNKIFFPNENDLNELNFNGKNELIQNIKNMTYEEKKKYSSLSDSIVSYISNVDDSYFKTLNGFLQKKDPIKISSQLHLGALYMSDYQYSRNKVNIESPVYETKQAVIGPVTVVAAIAAVKVGLVNTVGIANVVYLWNGLYDGTKPTPTNACAGCHNAPSKKSLSFSKEIKLERNKNSSYPKFLDCPPYNDNKLENENFVSNIIKSIND